ncbi:unnamed protein product [Closterium sp. NIES-53]
MGMALYRRAVLAASFRRPSAIRAVAARLSSSARLAPTARVGILLPFPRRVPPSTSRAALVCSPAAAPARHLDSPSSARSFRASLCAPRALAGIVGNDKQLLASACGGEGAGIGAIRGVSIGAGGSAADAQLRSSEERNGGAEVVRASASGGAEGGKEGRGKARVGKKSRSSYGAEHIQGVLLGGVGGDEGQVTAMKGGDEGQVTTMKGGDEGQVTTMKGGDERFPPTMPSCLCSLGSACPVPWLGKAPHNSLPMSPVTHITPVLCVLPPTHPPAPPYLPPRAGAGGVGAGAEAARHVHWQHRAPRPAPPGEPTALHRSALPGEPTALHCSAPPGESQPRCTTLNPKPKL